MIVVMKLRMYFVCNLYYHGGRHNYWFLAFCIIILSRKHVIIKIEAIHSEENQQFFGHKKSCPKQVSNPRPLNYYQNREVLGSNTSKGNFKKVWGSKFESRSRQNIFFKNVPLVGIRTRDLSVTALEKLSKFGGSRFKSQ